jgi:hypothetical protein
MHGNAIQDYPSSPPYLIPESGLLQVPRKIEASFDPFCGRGIGALLVSGDFSARPTAQSYRHF